MINTYTLKDATRRCGYRRENTMREKHLASDEDRERLGYDIIDGRVHLAANAVDKLAKDLEQQRRERGNWRVRNLGPWAEPGVRGKLRKRGRKTDV